MTVTLPTEALKDALNGDYEFLHAARYWDAGIRITVGDHHYFLKIVGGRVDRFDVEWDIFDPYDISIGGPEEGWGLMLQPVPPPFYHDFFGVFFRHGFDMGGNLESLYSHYDAVRRVLEIARALTNGQAA